MIFDVFGLMPITEPQRVNEYPLAETAKTADLAPALALLAGLVAKTSAD